MSVHLKLRSNLQDLTGFFACFAFHPFHGLCILFSFVFIPSNRDPIPEVLVRTPFLAAHPSIVKPGAGPRVYTLNPRFFMGSYFLYSIR